MFQFSIQMSALLRQLPRTLNSHRVNCHRVLYPNELALNSGYNGELYLVFCASSCQLFCARSARHPSQLDLGFLPVYGQRNVQCDWLLARTRQVLSADDLSGQQDVDRRQQRTQLHGLVSATGYHADDNFML